MDRHIKGLRYGSIAILSFEDDQIRSARRERRPFRVVAAPVIKHLASKRIDHAIVAVALCLSAAVEVVARSGERVEAIDLYTVRRRHRHRYWRIERKRCGRPCIEHTERVVGIGSRVTLDNHGIVARCNYPGRVSLVVISH